MTVNKTNSNIISLLLVVALVLGIFIGMPITASAASLGLSAPKSPQWNGNAGTWEQVPNAVVYEWELYRNDTAKAQDPDADESIAINRVYATATAGTTTVSTDLSSYLTKDGYYYFIVCALSDDLPITEPVMWSHSNYLEKSTNTVIPGNSGGGSSGGSGGGGSSSGASSTSSTPTPVTQNSNDIKDLATTAKANGQNVAQSKGTGEVTIKGSAWSQLSGLTFQHDTIANGAVQVRVTINNPVAITQDLKVSGYVTGSEVERVEKFFNKYFSNKTNVMHLDQTGSWGQEVRIAAKFDLTGMDKNNLVFYSYDKATNSYHKIDNPKYTIDTNGYTHFSTSLAGDIIVSNGLLVKK